MNPAPRWRRMRAATRVVGAGVLGWSVLLSIAAVSIGRAQLAPPTSAPATAPDITLAITSPGDDFTGLFINETAEMAARIDHGKASAKWKEGPYYNYAGKSVVPANYTVAWSTTMGSFTESYSPTTTFMNVSDIASPVKNLVWTANALEESSPLPKPPATAPAASAPATASAPQPKPLLGSPAALFLPDELQAEIATALAEPNRDARVERLRIALAQRPADPWGIVLAFNIATLLGQNVDEAHHQGVHPEEALAVLQEIVARYDHKLYYRPDSVGQTCSPSLMVPRAAIIAASVETGYLHDLAAARQYAIIALADLDWTFRTRTQDWAGAPMPAPLPPGIGGPFEDAKYKGRVAAWEQSKLDAARGKAIGPYEVELAEAAVRQYGLSFGPQRPEEVAGVMQPLIERYPSSPIAAAAQAHIERAKALAAATDGR